MRLALLDGPSRLSAALLMTSAPPLLRVNALRIRKGVLVPPWASNKVFVAPAGAPMTRLLMVRVLGNPLGGRGVVVHGLGARVRDQDQGMADEGRNTQRPVGSDFPFAADAVGPTVRAGGGDHHAAWENSVVPLAVAVRKSPGVMGAGQLIGEIAAGIGGHVGGGEQRFAFAEAGGVAVGLVNSSSRKVVLGVCVPLITVADAGIAGERQHGKARRDQRVGVHINAETQVVEDGIAEDRVAGRAGFDVHAVGGEDPCPLTPLKAMTLAAPLLVPPTRFPGPPISTPVRALPSGWRPVTSVPMKFPCTRLFEPSSVMPRFRLPEMTLPAPGTVPPMSVGRGGHVADQGAVGVADGLIVPVRSVPMKLP